MKPVTLFILCFLLINCGGSEPKVCPDKTCADYATQDAAQVAFDADRECLGELDNDNDKIACEELLTPTGGTGSQGGGAGGGNSGGGSSGTNCPTTANCGCSNKVKAQCGGPCCKWVTGSGCQCS